MPTFQTYVEITSAIVGTVESNPVNPVTKPNFRLKIISCLEGHKSL